MLSRRQLFQTVIAGAAVPHMEAAAPEAGWFDRPMRWGQLVFVEDDPGNYDPAFWLDYFRRTHCDAVCLAGGGYMAFYPTTIPFHHRSRWLKDQDAFGDLVKACRQAGMIVVARTDPHATYDDVAAAHPGWIAVDANGNKRRHPANPERWVTCDLGPYNFEFMTAVTREIVELYQVDGIFSNRWADTKMCYCEHCRANFKKASGLELPVTGDIADPARRAHTMWREQRLFDLIALWDYETRKANPKARFIPNAGGGAASPLDMKRLGEMSAILFADRQARRGNMAPWENGKNAKEYRAALGGKPIGGIFSVGVEEAYRWKDSVQAPEEIKVWAIDGIANGLRPWFAKFNAKIIDNRWLKPVEEVYTWHWRNEKFLRNQEPLARVAIVYSQQTARYYGGERMTRKVEDHTSGFYQALIEARIPFEMVHDRLLDQASLKNLHTLILPNIAALSEAQCMHLRQFVAAGGNLVATYETSLYDEWGTRRQNFGLSDLFGCSFDGKIEARMQNAYLTVERAADGSLHPLLRGFEDTPRMIHGVSRIHVRPNDAAYRAPLTLVPSYPDLPMEDVYARVPKTGIPQVFARQAGRGRVVYFPWDVDRTFWEILHADHARLLRNAVEWAHGEEQPVRITGGGMLDVTIWRQRDSMTVHLVNLTNPMAMRGSYREVIELGPLHARILIPEGFRPGAVKLLVSGARVNPRRRGGSLEVTMPKLGMHEVIAIDGTWRS